MTRARRGAALALALLAVGALVAPAGAHSVLLSSDPADGARLQRLPEQVVLDFSDDVVTLGTQVEVTVDGGAMTAGEPVVEGSRVRVPLDGDAQSGRYVVLWRVTSSDGHPVSGELGFAVAEPPAGAPATTGGAAPVESPAPTATSSASRSVSSAATTAPVAGSATAATTSGGQTWWLAGAGAAVLALGLGTRVWLGRRRAHDLREGQ